MSIRTDRGNDPQNVALKRGLLAAYGAPALPLAAMYFPVFVFLAEFYSRTLGLSLAALGAIFLAVRLIDAVSDPAVGLLSDRWPARLGRRRFWLGLSCPFIMLSVWMLFVPPPEAGLWWFGGWITALTLGWTLALTPYFAWGAELSGDYAERTRVTTWREALGLVGTVLAALLYASGGEDAGLGLQRVALFIIVLLPIAVGLCLVKVPEPRNFTKSNASFSSLILILTQERRFRRLLLSFFLNGAGNGVSASLFIFYATHRLDAPGTGGLLLVVYFACAVIAAPFWPWATRHMPKHRLWCLAMIYAAIVYSATIFLGAGDVFWFGVVCMLSGFALGADLALPSAIQADLVDIDTAQNRAQRTGAFFALWSVVTKAALAVSGGIVFVALDWIGFEAQGDNGPQALLALALFYGMGPIVLKLWAVWLMWDFPMDASEVADLRRKIEADTS